MRGMTYERETRRALVGEALEISLDLQPR